MKYLRPLCSVVLGLTLLLQAMPAFADSHNGPGAPDDLIDESAQGLAPGKLQKGIPLISGFCGDLNHRLQGTGLQLFENYFDCIWKWLLSIAGGIAVLNGVIGGTMIMFAGDDSGMRGEGINKLKFSIVGLLMVAFAGTILVLLNPTFYE